MQEVVVGTIQIEHRRRVSRLRPHQGSLHIQHRQEQPLATRELRAGVSGPQIVNNARGATTASERLDESSSGDGALLVLEGARLRADNPFYM